MPALSRAAYGEGMSEVCPNDGRVEPVLEWCRSDDGRLHLGVRCPRCRLWLRWVAARTRPPVWVPLFRKVDQTTKLTVGKG